MSKGYDPSQLHRFATEILQRVAVPQADAELVADTLVENERHGHPSHGLLRLSWYVARLETGAVKAVTETTYVVDAGAVAVIDGNDGIGQVITTRAMRDAIARAKAHGVGVVGVRRSNHFGTAAYYTRLAAEEGCIGFLSTNSSPSMAPWGGRTKAVGANPWSIASPSGHGSVAVLDIANGHVARGKIYAAMQRGEPIPEGWALGPDGEATTDPSVALAGVLLPMAGHKGYAISFMMDVLSGVLTGSSFGSAIIGPQRPEGSSGAGHLAMALDISAFTAFDGFEERMRTLTADMKGQPLAPGFNEILVPGELEARYAAKVDANGIELPDLTRQELTELAGRLGVETPF